MLGARIRNCPLTGYELAARAEYVIGDFWSLTQSQVYRELALMADAGLVTAGERGTRERRPYSVTDAGCEAFAAWIDRPPGPETIRHPLLLTVSFGDHVHPERLAAFLRQHREAHAERLRTHETQAAESERSGIGKGDPYRAATLAFGLAYGHAWVGMIRGYLHRGPDRAVSFSVGTLRPGGQARSSRPCSPSWLASIAYIANAVLGRTQAPSIRSG